METVQARPLFHRVAEARRQLGIGNTKFYELVKQGHLRLVKIGTCSLVPDEDLVRLADSLKETASANKAA